MPTKRNRETNDAFKKHLYHRVHQTIQRNKMFANDARFPFKILECVETESRLSAHAVRSASMILRTARFLCGPYAEICVNAIPDRDKLSVDNPVFY